MFNRVDQIRVVRNKIVHQDRQGNMCSPHECCDALVIAANLIEEVIGFKINLNLSQSISGT